MAEKERREKLRKARKENWKDPEYRSHQLSVRRSSRFRQNQSRALRKAWEHIRATDPAYTGHTHDREEKVRHPKHYGGDDIYEVIKVIEAWEMGSRSETSGFNLGNAVKYIARVGLKGTDYLEDLRKARWYLQHEIDKEKERRK